MALTLVTDILIRGAPSREALRNAMSRSFGVDSGMVTVTEATGKDPIPDDVRILLLRQPESMPGDFPAWYSFSVAPDLVGQIDEAMNGVAKVLDTVILTEAENYSDMTMHLPDGSARVVGLYQDDDDAFRITPEIQALIDEATARPRAVQAEADATPVDLSGGRDGRVRRAS